MSFKRNKLRDAISFALATTLMGSGFAYAQDTTATTDEAKELETIQVTGSRIRRVDTETASPVIAIDRAAIEKSGKLTLGDLVQELPNIAGAPTNPQVNNGGGTGVSAIELRGLGSQRTLVLINGRRMVNGSEIGGDLNAIPASAVERIEVLSSGASAVYGSDAVAGVVNFIMRSDYQGMEASADVGISSRGDGFRRGASFTWGQTTDKGNVTAGVNYNKFDAIMAGARAFSKDATYLYSGTVTVLGSSRNPRGRAFFNSAATSPEDAALRAQFGCATVTRIPGEQGDNLGDYRCYSGAADSYNYQPENYILTPQERMNGFVLGNYAITDNLTAFVELYHNNTTSQFAIAPLPFDAIGDGVTISRDNFYNPFGVDFGPTDDGITDRNYLTRFTALGQRKGNYKTTTDQGILGVKGVFGDTWQWDAAYNYGHYSLLTQSQGYVYYEGLRAALGPSFDAGGGNIVCGTPGNVIANCTPLDIFNVLDPDTIAVLQNYVVTPFYQNTYIMRSYEVNANGEIFDLPAGAANLAVGVSHRSEYDNYRVDFVAQTTGEDGTCFISQEACSTPQRGGFNVREAYAELFLPILKDAPGATALNIILGSRYSDYSTFGDTVNSKLAVEWKPIDDLLVRGTVSEVFRAPGITDIFQGAAGNAPNFTDACLGYGLDPDGAGPLQPDDAPGYAEHANACGLPTGATAIDPTTGTEATGLSQTSGVVSGAASVGYDLTPEEGKSFNFGLVWDPGFLPGFSAALDYWRIYLNNTIFQVDAQQVVDVCFVNPASFLCQYIHRQTNGQVLFIQQPTVNLGRLDVKGVDLSLKYRAPETSFGKFSFGLDATRLMQYDNNPDPDFAGSETIEVGGTYNRSYGNYPHWRALFSVGWTMGDWNASIRSRYIGTSKIIDADGSPDFTTELGIPSITTHNIAVGYNFSAINSRVDIGVDNVTDKQPPFLFQNNVINANTDVNTYDTIGRYMWARFTVKF
jgi:iron complex outermembrane receptor protein